VEEILDQNSDSENLETPVLSKFTFITDVPMKSVSKDDGKKRVRLTASTDAEDLVGDIMSKNALQQMENAAPGTTIFLNHDATVPYSVFGAVEKASLVERKVPVTQEDGSKSMIRLNCLDYDVIVEESNKAAVDTYNIIEAGNVQLGASVTIGITDTTALKGGRQQIDGVVYLETSIVGIPCNQTAWAWAKYVKSSGWSRKALKSLNKSQALVLLSTEGTPVDLAITENGIDHKLNSEKEDTVNEMSASKTIENVKTTLRKAANKAQAVVAFKDLFTDQVEEHFESPWLYMDLLAYALMDLVYWNMSMPKDEKMAAAAEMLDAFKLKMVEILDVYFTEDEESEKSIRVKAAFLEGASAYVVKAGKRNNKKDKSRIQDIHDLSVELEAECMADEKAVDKTDDKVVEKTAEPTEAPKVEEKTAEAGSPTTMELVMLLAEATTSLNTATEAFSVIEAKNKELEERIEGVEKSLTASQEETAKWKALANTAAAVVEEHLSSPATT